jgi:DNA-damage-inducible protein D
MAGEKLAPPVRELTNVDCGRFLSEIKERITIKAKDFANEINNFNTQQNEMRTEFKITDEHVRNNREVRQLLVDSGIVPEALPPAEDVKKVERRLKTERTKLPKQVDPFDKQETDIE